MGFAKILFVRRDNIGDLICTTPAIHAVREQFPQAKIGVLVNTYIAEIIRLNPDIDKIHVFQKPKHARHRSKLAVWWENFRVYRRIWRQKYEVAIGCGLYNDTLGRYTFFTGARRRIGYCRDWKGRFYYNLPQEEPRQQQHEVVSVFKLLAPLGLEGEPGDMVLRVDETELHQFQQIKSAALSEGKPLVAVSISSRLRQNRWPLENYIALIRGVLEEGKAGVLLLWSPGAEENLVSPGDDQAAAHITSCFPHGLLAYRTPGLQGLIAALAGADLVVTPDTGTLHIAAALKKPTVALMMAVKAPLWYPWKTASRVLTASRRVADIPVGDVHHAIHALLPSH